VGVARQFKLRKVGSVALDGLRHLHFGEMKEEKSCVNNIGFAIKIHPYAV
jgi:hypothetical protein